jgi:hypothetical protein
MDGPGPEMMVFRKAAKRRESEKITKNLASSSFLENEWWPESVGVCL